MSAVPKPASIARHPRAAPPGDLGFAALRERGIALAQALSGQHWTDYNLHDPGVTLLEALCFALTELVYRADFPVADLLGPDAEGRLDYAGLALHPPEQALPCRATSAADLRQLLLDAVPGLDEAGLLPPAPGAEELSSGLHTLRLSLSPAWGGPPAERLRQARQAYRSQRQLGEDLAPRLVLVRERWCELRLELELGGPREAGEVLAEVLQGCADFIARPPGFVGLDELRRQGLSLEQIHTGPATLHGRVRAEAPRAELFISDLGLLIQRVEGVQQLRALALLVDGQVHAGGALPWRGPDWALRLRLPGQAGADETEAQAEARAAALVRQLRLTRRGTVLQLSAAELVSRLADLVAAGTARRRGRQTDTDTDASVALPRGRPLPPQPYHSLQHDLPPIYGLGRLGSSGAASVPQRAAAAQLKAYLVLSEQLLANAGSQLAHLHALFSPRGAQGASYWWQPLGEAEVPGLDALYRGAPEALAQRQARLVREVFAPLDPSAERKSRVLDHLLALHGVSYKQNTMRQFWSYLAPAELEQLLLDNKADYLRQILALTRERAAAIDYSRPSWDAPDNASGLQRRVSLLLGFRHGHTRSLCQVLRQQQRELLEAADYASQRDLMPPRDSAPPTQPLPAQEPGAASLEQRQADLRAMPPLQQRRLSAPLLRAALFRERFRLGARDAAGRWPLWLGPDEQGRWWPLGHCANLAAALRAADSLRRFALLLNRDSEGLHVVEHVLLRPLGDSPGHRRLGLGPDFYALRLSVVLPAWTQRCQQANFRLLAAETVQLNAPAHLRADCLWLEGPALLRFEQAWQDWLARKQAFSLAAAGLPDEAQADPAAIAALDAAACAVLACLRAAQPGAADD